MYLADIPLVDLRQRAKPPCIVCAMILGPVVGIQNSRGFSNPGMGGEQQKTKHDDKEVQMSRPLTPDDFEATAT
jgi:hypothetical protein